MKELFLKISQEFLTLWLPPIFKKCSSFGGRGDRWAATLRICLFFLNYGILKSILFVFEKEKASVLG